MSHTNKFTRNARLRRFAPGSVPAENSAPPVFYGPPYAFREYLGGEGFIHPGPPLPLLREEVLLLHSLLLLLLVDVRDMRVV